MPKGDGRGGPRPGAGRKKGVPNKRTILRLKIAKETGEMPHEFLLRIARGEKIGDYQPTFAERQAAAVQAAPYYAPKLAATEHRHQFDLSRLDDAQLAELARVRSLVALAGSDRDGDPAAAGTEAPEDHGTKH